MLTGKQKRYLRAEASQMKALFQIGKHGLSDNLMKQLDDLLEKRELIKVSVLQNCLEDKHVLAEEISETTGAYIVQIIGNNIILYRESTEDKQLRLP